MAEVLSMPASPRPMSMGGIMSAGPIPPAPDPVKVNASQPVQGLAAHVRKAWETNKKAKDGVEQRMLKSLRQRRGEYDPEKLEILREQGGSTIYMMLTSAKCRAASAWIRDVFLSQSSEKPWMLDATPVPELPPEVMTGLYQESVMEVQQALQMGLVATPEAVRSMLEEKKSQALEATRESAKKTIELMEREMEDQLVEGDFHTALNQFLDDLVTFPAAFMKGPVVRRRKTMQWVQGMDGTWGMDVQDELRPEWERVDPFDIYPAAYASSINEGDLLEHHRLSRSELNSLIGVDGYSEDAIRKVLEEYGRGGLREWTRIDQEKASAEGREDYDSHDTYGLIDALQYWGTVQGELLIEWGMTPEEVPDPLSDYAIEAWLIGQWVIKAVINPDPLGHRPYYSCAFEKIPGMLWGNSVPDLIRDAQDMCNSSARALANNMGIASGPLVWYNMDRMPVGDSIDQLYPWKIIPFESDPVGGSAAPMGFFQPNSNAQELLVIYEKFATLADEYSGIPRYIAGDANVGGAGRTASGLSMLMSNAGKAMKQVIANMDQYVMVPLLTRLYNHNMRYGEDESVKGDAKVVARGVNAMLVKESAQVRRNEFLATTANPIDMQIVGIEGRAALLREAAKSLDMNPDKIVPTQEELQRRAIMMSMQPQMSPGQQGGPQAQPGGASSSGQNLMDGTAQTDDFSPMRQ